MCENNEQKNDLKEFLNRLREYGGRCTNPRLQEALGWDRDHYWEVHRRAVDSGLAIRGRGRGGIIILTEVENRVYEENAENRESQAEQAENETIYYNALISALEEYWVKGQGFDGYKFEITAHRGRRNTGGKWTRPDLILLSKKVYPYLPDKRFEIITFEVKIISKTDIDSFYEALSHNTAATRTYMVFIGEYREGGEQVGDMNSFSNLFRGGVGIRIIDRSIQHGIGIIYVEKDMDGNIIP